MHHRRQNECVFRLKYSPVFVRAPPVSSRRKPTERRGAVLSLILYNLFLPDALQHLISVLIVYPTLTFGNRPPAFIFLKVQLCKDVIAAVCSHMCGSHQAFVHEQRYTVTIKVSLLTVKLINDQPHTVDEKALRMVCFWTIHAHTLVCSLEIVRKVTSLFSRYILHYYAIRTSTFDRIIGRHNIPTAVT